MTITVSTYCNEYVRRLEQDREMLIHELIDAGYDPKDLEDINDNMPPRRGVSQIQDGPKWKEMSDG